MVVACQFHSPAMFSSSETNTWRYSVYTNDSRRHERRYLNALVGNLTPDIQAVTAVMT
jgi:hypothetical protein